MCRATTDQGGPRRCPGDARAAAQSAHTQVEMLENDRDLVLASLRAAADVTPGPDKLSMEMLVALHPEHEQSIRSATAHGQPMTFSNDLITPDGRPALIGNDGSPVSAVSTTHTSAPEALKTTAAQARKRRRISDAKPVAQELVGSISNYSSPTDRITPTQQSDGWTPTHSPVRDLKMSEMGAWFPVVGDNDDPTGTTVDGRIEGNYLLTMSGAGSESHWAAYSLDSGKRVAEGTAPQLWRANRAATTFAQGRTTR